MKTILLSFLAVLLSITLYSQENTEKASTTTAAIAPATEQGNNLELAAVLDLFKDAKDLGDFEKQLNDEKVGINNLDLNNDSIIDYIRVVEKTEGNYRVIILQAVLGENQFQDVATINVEKVSDEEIKVQCQGDEEIYGENYYVEPEPKIHVHVHLWPIWGVMYAPHYSYYHSPYYWHYYPTYWHPYRPVPYTTYSSRTVVVTNRGVYVHSRHAVVRRPPVYHRTYSSRAVVYPNSRNNYNRPPNGSNTNPNNGNRNPNNGNTGNRNPNTGNTGNRNPNTGNSTGTRDNNSSRQNSSSGSTQQRNNSGTQQKKPSTQQRSGSSQQRGSSTKPRSGGTQQRSSGAQPRSGGGQQRGGGVQPRSGGGRSPGRR